MTRQYNHALLCSCLVAVVVAGHDRPAICQETTIVYPNQFADVEGNAGDDATRIWQDGTRTQAVFFAAEFATLPSSASLISGYRWRPDGFTVTSPLTRTWTHLSLRLSTTQIDTLDELSTTFSDNTGPDEVLVYDGPMTWSTENIGPTGGPKAFDYEIMFDAPFAYDPSQGNLLIDWTNEGPSPDIGYDSERTPNLALAAFAASSTALFGSKSANGTGIFQFIFVPEPSAAFLLLTGLLGLAGFRRCR